MDETAFHFDYDPTENLTEGEDDGRTEIEDTDEHTRTG